MSYRFWLGVLVMIAQAAWATGPRVAPTLFTPPDYQLHAPELPPFISAQARDNGVLPALVQEVFQREQIDAGVRLEPLPAMAHYYFLREQALAIVGRPFPATTPGAKQAIFVPVLTVDEYYYQPARYPALAWRGELNAFKNKRLGLEAGVSAQEYAAAGIRIERGRALILLEKLRDGQLDLVRLPARTVQALRQDADQTLTRLEPKAGRLVLGVSFNRRHPDGEALAKRFRSGLARLLNEGLFQAIVQDHLGADVDIKALTIDNAP